MGAIQGMGVSSVASTNLGPRFGLVNLPFLIDTNDKLEKFIDNKELFGHFLKSMDHQGIMALDVTTYGSYGWASTEPIRSIADMKKAKFRIAEAAVNQLTYKQWGVNPVPMPWPDVPVALKQGVITALDHTDLVCDLTKKFEVAKFFTEINYAKGLFIWIFNKAWFNSLPADLQKTFVEVVHDVCADYRAQGAQQEIDVKAKITAAGIQLFQLPPEEMAMLRKQGNVVHQEYANEINKLFEGDTYRPENFLQQVQDFVGYKP
jgi:TRAP-type C4-dicarboxylate transport system substrate-binding protein